jgi:hypothetical protein
MGRHVATVRVSRYAAVRGCVLVLVGAVAIGLLYLWGWDEPDHSELQWSVLEAAHLLRLGDEVGFLGRFLKPEDQHQVIGVYGSIENAAKEFERNGRGEVILRRLEAAARSKPSIEAHGLRAVYRFEAPISGDMRIAFVKVGSRWVLE